MHGFVLPAFALLCHFVTIKVVLLLCLPCNIIIFFACVDCCRGQALETWVKFAESYHATTGASQAPGGVIARVPYVS